MNNMAKLALPVCLLAVIMMVTGSAGSVPNLNEDCFRCLCSVTTKCDLTNECAGGYCGPFNISRVYWADAGKPVLTDVKLENTETKPEDTTEVKLEDKPRVKREVPVKIHEDYVSCARDYECSKLIIEGYMAKYGKDCNGDGITNCFDYMLVHGLGSWGCAAGLENHRNGPAWLKRYAECKL